MAVTLAAAGRLGAVHHRLEPAGHVHLQDLVAADEAVLLEEGGGGDGGEGQVSGVSVGQPGRRYDSHSLGSHQQPVVFWPFSVILCEAVEGKCQRDAVMRDLTHTELNNKTGK